MGRFNPMAPASGSSSHNQPPPAVPAHAEKEKPKDNMSFSSIASMATMGKSMTKSLGAGLHTVATAASLPNPLGNGSSNNAEIEKKTKQAATEKKLQIAQVLTILEDVHLQCPPSHSGIILAYTGANCAPIINPGIRFTWFRMSGEDRVDQVDESTKAWYAPSVDDIGAVICAQCEDNYYQGCSRYIEVRRTTDSSLNHTNYIFPQHLPHHNTLLSTPHLSAGRSKPTRCCARRPSRLSRTAPSKRTACP